MSKPDDQHPRPWWPRGVAPRDYAAAIEAANGDPKKIEQIWNKIPEEYRETVAIYVKDWANRARMRKELATRRGRARYGR